MSFSEQNPIVGIYKGVVVEDDPFLPGSKRLMLTIEVDGVERKIGSKSKRLARELINVEPEQKISITRSGQMMETKYKVEVVGDTEEKETTEEKEVTPEDLPF